MYDHGSLVKNLPRHIGLDRSCDLTLHITDACPFKCVHCFQQQLSQNSAAINSDQAELIAAAVHRSKIKIRTLTLTGGEPFLCKDIGPITDTLIQQLKPHAVHINTNGFLPQTIYEFVNTYCAKANAPRLRIQLSFYGSPETHNTISQHALAFTNLDHTVSCLETFGSRINIKFCTPIMRLNFHEAEQIADYAKQHPHELSISPLKEVVHSEHQGLHTFNSNSAITVHEFATFLTALETHLPNTDIWSRNNRIRNKAYLKVWQGQDLGRCHFQDHNVIIFSNGDYTFCEHYPAQGDLFNNTTIINRHNRKGSGQDCRCLSYSYFCGKFLGR